MKELNAETLKKFEEEIERLVPGAYVGFKDESRTMWLLGLLATPFNPQFMTGYITTWGKGVYFPSRKHYGSSPSRSFRILAHELVHLRDAKDDAWYFKLSYMMPQAAAVPLLAASAAAFWPHSWIVLLPFIGYVLAALANRLWRPLFWAVLSLSVIGVAVLTVTQSGWLMLGCIMASLLPLGPWPSPWRTKWEIRGYGMNVALAQWLYQKFSSDHLKSITSQFTGPSYLFMCWNRAKIVQEMTDYSRRARSGDLREDPYKVVHDFLKSP